MFKIPKDYYSNLSCYEEFVIRTNLLGYDVSNDNVLNSLRIVNTIDTYYWFVIGEIGNRHICIVDKCGNKVENAVLKGYFDCSYFPLDSLEGGPVEVEGDFYCHACKHLETLKGAPRKVGGYFCCMHCHSLTSLEGSPIEVGGDFNCSNCNRLTSLEYGPKKIGGIILNHLAFCQMHNDIKQVKRSRKAKE